MKATRQDKPLPPRCPCGVSHRTGRRCSKGQRILDDRREASEVLEALRRLPANTLAILDTRRGTGRARTLPTTTSLALTYADGAEDPDWGSVQTTTSREVLRFQVRDGGAVANAYRYPAEADASVVVAGAGRVVVYVTRARARTRPHGGGQPEDWLPAASLVAEWVRYGQRHGVAFLAAIERSRRVHALAGRDRATMTPEEQVELDRAMDEGEV